MRIVAFDLSLTTTGWAADDMAGVLKPGKRRGCERLDWIEGQVAETALGADLVILEGYSYASPHQAHQLGELGGTVRLGLWRREQEWVDIPPAVLKRYGTGKGNADKDAMLAAAIRRFGFEGDDNNAADAWLLRAMGLAAYSDWGPVTDYQQEALNRIDWPKLDVVERVG